MSLSDVIGHEKPVSRLRKAIEAGRVASAYLFAGERGIGKKYTALNLAKALNCKKSKDGCSEADTYACPSCKKMQAGTHPDLFLIAPEKGVIKVEVIRGVEDSLSLRSFEGGYKVVIIDEAETMRDAAANAFLKTLEEPPPGSVIILVTSSPDGLLETIRSRCVKIGFRPLSSAECAEVIGRQGGAGEIDAAVRLSMGRPGLALEEDLMSERERFMESLGEITSGGRPAWKEREDIERWLDLCLCLLRDMAVLKVTGRPAHLVHSDRVEAIARMCEGRDLKVIMKCYGKLLKVRESLRFNLNKNITWNYVGSVLKGTLAS